MKINFSLNRNNMILLAVSCLALILVVVIVMWIFVIRTPSVDTREARKEIKPLAQREAAPSVIKQPQKTVKQAIPATAAETTSVSTKIVKAEKPPSSIKEKAALTEEKPPVKVEKLPSSIKEKAAVAEEKPLSAMKKKPAVAEEKQPEPVTEIAKIKTPKVIEKKPAAKPRYSVQVGAFRNSKNANRFVSQLKQKGYGAYIFMKTDPKARTWHTVRIGDYTNLREASSARSMFKKKEKKPALVTLFDSLKAAPGKP